METLINSVRPELVEGSEVEAWRELCRTGFRTNGINQSLPGVFTPVVLFDK